jgi:hypothetical protein
MNERQLKIFFKALDAHGHKSANVIMGIITNEFCVFSRINDLNENIRDLEQSKFGGILYTDNTDFLQDFKSSIQNSIISETSIFSNLFNSMLKILVFRQEDEALKFIYELPSRSILRIL